MPATTAARQRLPSGTVREQGEDIIPRAGDGLLFAVDLCSGRENSDSDSADTSRGADQTQAVLSRGQFHHFLIENSAIDWSCSGAGSVKSVLGL